MKTILHISTFLQGGAGKIICDLIADQVMQGNNVSCMVNAASYPGYESYPEYEARLSDLGVPLLKLDGLFKRELIGLVRAGGLISQYIASQGVNFVHCHSAVPSLAAVIARGYLKANLPIIQTMHGWGTNKTVLQEQLDLEVLAKVDRLIAVSKSSKSLLAAKGVPLNQVTVIYNGVDKRPECPDQAHARLLPAAVHAFSVVCLGTLCDRKNQSLLIDAINLLVSSGSDIQCVFIGEDNNDYADSLKEKVNSNGLADRIRFMGCIDQADRYLSEFDVLVLPSRAEGMPLSIIEAFRENTLVIASDISECRELLEPEVTGLLFAADSVDSLCAAMLRAMNLSPEARKDITDRACLKYQSAFTKAHMLAGYTRLYQEELNASY